MNSTAVLLAAGQGTRMKSSLPKVLHPLAGIPMVQFSLRAVQGLSTDLPVVVVGHGAEEVQKQLAGLARFAIQEHQLGTAHAVQAAQPLIEAKTDLVIVISADMPLLSAETIGLIVEQQKKNNGPMTMLSIVSDNSHGFGRVLRGEHGSVSKIVEEAVATPEQLAVKELNAGVYCFDNNWLWSALEKIKKSPKGEYYLTDTVEVAVSEGLPVCAVVLSQNEEAIGINTRVHLAEAEKIMRRRINEKLMLSGVTIIDPDTTYIGVDVQIDQDTIIYPNTTIRGTTTIGKNCTIGPNSVIESTQIGSNCTILASVLEFALLEDHVEIGPYGHLRKGAHLASHVHMGNFGEVKNSYLAPGAKMGHFSYLGDAKIGKDVNIGAGTITCNFDGVNKFSTVVGDHAFIGSDTMLVAPVTIGEGAKTGAGSVVTHDVPPSSVVVGVPAKPLKKEKSE